MGKPKFNSLVKTYFGYLENQYGFALCEEKPDSTWLGSITYESKQKAFQGKQLVIQFILDRGYVDVQFNTIPQVAREWIDLAEIMKVIDPSAIPYESADTSDITHITNPQPVSFRKLDFSRNPNDIVEDQLRNLSIFMSRYCASLLSGDISVFDQIIEARKKVTEDRIILWKEMKERRMNSRKQ